MHYSLLFNEITFQIPAGKSLLVKYPDLSVEVVACLALSSLLYTPLSQHLSQPVVSVIYGFPSLGGLPTIAEANSCLSLCSQHSAQYVSLCSCCSNAGVLNLGPISLLGCIILCGGGDVLCVVGCLAASLAFSH